MAGNEGPTTPTSQTGQDKKYSPIQHKPCQICEGKATGYHFGVISCEACKSFFRRSLKRKKAPICERDGDCPLIAADVVGIPCPACRLKRCVQRGMSENAVKKGRYSLDRRAEAILESRQYWSPGNPQESAVKDDVSLSSPPITDGASSSGSSVHESRSGLPSASMSSSANSLSADDFFTLMSEMCGDDMAEVPSVTDPTSTINALSLSPLLNDPTLNIDTAPPNIQSLSDFSSSSSLQGQFTFRMEPTQPDPLNAIKSTLIPDNEIKKEFQTQRSGYELPKPCQNGLSSTAHEVGPPQGCLQYTTGPAGFEAAGTSHPNYPSTRASSAELVKSVQNSYSKHKSPEDLDILCKLLLSDFKVKDDQDYIIDEIVAAFDKQNFTNKGFLAKVSDQQHKYLEGQKEEERMFGPISKLSSHEFIQMYKETGVDIDGRLTIMQQHADVMDDWVRQVMQFYKGIPGFTDLPLRDQMSLIKGSKWQFGTCTYFPNFDVHRNIEVSPLIQDCVVDIKFMKAMVPNTDELMDQWMCIIGTKCTFGTCAYFPLFDVKNKMLSSAVVEGVIFDFELIKAFYFAPVDDMMSASFIVIGTKLPFYTGAYFPYTDVRTGLLVSPLVDCVLDKDFMCKSYSDVLADSLEKWYHVIERLQNLQITDREYTMMTALFVIDPDECVTERGKEQCKQLSGKLDDAFRHLLKKRLSYDKTDEIMTNIKEIRELLRPISLKYNVEYFLSMKMYSEHCGVKYGQITWQYYEM